MIDQENMPDPELVLRAAEEEISDSLLDPYWSAISKLHEKGFTFRKIADWFNTKFNLGVDRDAVWRAFANNVSDLEAAHADQEDEEMEQEEAIREADRNNGWGVSVPPPANSAVPANPTTIEPTPVVSRKRGGKMAFVRNLLTHQSQKVTKAEAIALYRKAFPNVRWRTATNTVNWTVGDLKRKGIEITGLRE